MRSILLVVACLTLSGCSVLPKKSFSPPVEGGDLTAASSEKVVETFGPDGELIQRTTEEQSQASAAQPENPADGAGVSAGDASADIDGGVQMPVASSGIGGVNWFWFVLVGVLSCLIGAAIFLAKTPMLTLPAILKAVLPSTGALSFIICGGLMIAFPFLSGFWQVAIFVGLWLVPTIQGNWSAGVANVLAHKAKTQ